MRAHMYVELPPVSHPPSRQQLDLIVLIDFLTTWYIARNAVTGGLSAVILARNFAICPANPTASARKSSNRPILLKHGLEPLGASTQRPLIMLRMRLDLREARLVPKVLK